MTTEALQAAFPDVDFSAGDLPPCHGQNGPLTVIRVAADRLLDVLNFLRNDERCMMEQLCDLTCVDYLNFPDATERFGVTYSLLSLSLNHRLWVKCMVNPPQPTVPSA